jgi:Flp pilus assembly protein TadD
VFGRNAVSSLEAALSLYPWDRATWSALGGLQFRQGNIATAERAARQALALNPENRSSIFFAGMIVLSERRFDEARDKALSILQLWPNDMEGMTLLGPSKMKEHQLRDKLFRVTAPACASPGHGM